MTAPSAIELPAGLLALPAHSPGWDDWLTGLPTLARQVLTEWALTLDGPARHGMCALVLPVQSVRAGPAVLKCSFPHDEERDEHIGLKALAGSGAVRLLRADPARHAMLLERLHADRDLTRVDVEGACRIVGGLYRRLHIPAPPQLRPLSSYVRRWTDELTRLDRDAPLPRRLVEQAVTLARELVAEPGRTMIHGDLHYENVLAGDREPWLVIDPKPMSGDPHYEVAPMLWNRWAEAVATGDLRRALRRRFAIIVETAGLQADRARDWVVVRMVHNGLWAIQDALEESRGLTREDHEWITQCVTIAKAVQD